MAASLSLLSPAAGPAELSQVWRAAELGRVDGPVLSTGYSTLDAQLPGGGWPLGAMIEVLQEQLGAREWQLMLPALARLAGTHSGPVVLVGAPHVPFGPALAARGLPLERLLWVDALAPAARLWACEQALRCFDAAAVLAWLPQARASALRRLHMAAQDGGKLFFVFRHAAMQHESSASPLRLLLSGLETMTVHIVKRRGPPLATPLALPARAPRLAALLAASKTRRTRLPTALLIPSRADHALDRVAAAA